MPPEHLRAQRRGRATRQTLRAFWQRASTSSTVWLMILVDVTTTTLHCADNRNIFLPVQTASLGGIPTQRHRFFRLSRTCIKIGQTRPPCQSVRRPDLQDFRRIPGLPLYARSLFMTALMAATPMDAFSKCLCFAQDRTPPVRPISLPAARGHSSHGPSHFGTCRQCPVAPSSSITHV
jgi:hypothetical protein